MGLDGTASGLPPSRPVTVFETQAAIPEPRAAERTGELRCPECLMAHDGAVRGPFMMGLFALMRIPPYRCRACRRRFSGFHAPVMRQTEGEAFSAFLSPGDGRSFDDLIRALAADEHDAGGGRPQFWRAFRQRAAPGIAAIGKLAGGRRRSPESSAPVDP